MVGQLVGNYRIVSRLAEGGMGVIYLAEHRHMGRRAAVKFLLPELSQKQNIIARFFDEARAASHVEHPGIVQIFDCDYYAPTGQAYLVMEFLQGATLREHLTNAGGPLPEGRAVHIALGIAEPLAAAHAKGIVHRDLKPENVFLVGPAGKETVKILDFGVAKLTAALRSSANSTVEGSILGTPLYMSPEQCRGMPNLDGRADIYSLGCLLFEMVCGRPPFIGDTPTALIAAHLCDAPPEPRQFAPGLSDQTAALLRSMLEKEPAARPRDVGAVIEALAAGARNPAPRAATPSATQVLPPAAGGSGATVALPAGQTAARVHATTLSEAASESLVDEGTRTGRRRWPLWGMLAAAALAVLIAGGFLISARPSGDGAGVTVVAPPAMAPEPVPARVTPPPPARLDPPPPGGAGAAGETAGHPDPAATAPVAPRAEPKPQTGQRPRKGARGSNGAKGAARGGAGVATSPSAPGTRKPPDGSGRLPIE